MVEKHTLNKFLRLIDDPNILNDEAKRLYLFRHPGY
jgi:hypothetical protein